MPVWVDWPIPKEEGRQKSDRNGSGSWIGGRVGGKDTIQNIGVDPHLWVMEILGELLTAAHS